jgi:succinoglycan biosynthesis transport protein ExoP
MSAPIQRVSNAPIAPPMGPNPMMMRAGAPMQNMSMTPQEIVGILRRHMWKILLLTFFGTVMGGAAFVLLNRLCPKYTAVAGIDVLPPVDTHPLQFGGTQPQKDLYYQFRFTKASLIKQQNMLEELLQQDKIRRTKWFSRFAQVNAQGEIIGDRDKAVRKCLDDLDRHLGAVAPRDQDFIRISMTCGSPQEAALIVDETIRLFLSKQQELARRSISEQLKAKREQQDKIQMRLREIEGTLDRIRQGSSYAIRFDIKGQSFQDYMDRQLSDIARDQNELATRRSDLESQIAILKARAESDEFDKIVQQSVEQDPIVRQIQASLSLAEPKHSQLLSRFGSEHRLVQESYQSIEQLKTELEARKTLIGDLNRKSNRQFAEDQMVGLHKQLETITMQLQEAQKNYREAELVRAEYNKTDILREEQQALLEDIKEYIEGLTAKYEDPKLCKLQSLGSAPVPLVPSFPNLKLFLPAGFMLGLLAGLGLAFAIELLNDRLRTPSDAVRHLRAPLLGTICHAEDDEDAESVELSHVVRQAPYSIMSECYRQLRTNLKLSKGGSEHKSLLVTSPAAGDGKTSVAVNLASTMIAENKKVLLIDTNFRRPTATNLFPRTGENGAIIEHPDYGLSNYLLGQCRDEDQIIRPAGVAGLYLIDSGPLPANPAELLDSPRMRQLLEVCNQRFDHVIIDGPPLLVSDAKTLASVVDGTIVVFNTDTTHRGAAQRVLRELDQIGANTVGTVLMGVKTRKGGYFQEVYRSYQEYQRVHVNPNI